MKPPSDHKLAHTSAGECVAIITPASGHDSLVASLSLLASIVIGIGAQVAIAAGHTTPGILAHAVAAACAIFGVQPVYRGVELQVRLTRRIAAHWQPVCIITALVASAGTFALSGDNRYRTAGVLLWIISVLGWWAAWADVRLPVFSIRQLQSIIRKPSVVALIAVLALGAAFRFAYLSGNPLEMGSDHVEKLLDVHDVLDGTPYIFFERNTGREPWQFYWTVLLVKLLHIPPDFMALKSGTSLIGWLMLPAVFLLAREVFGARIALLATLFAAVASWAVIPARFGLRYPLAPCAVAWTMYFLVRGLRRDERNAMLAAGICLGVGLQGYTAYRFMPVIFALLVLFGLVWYGAQGQRDRVLPALVNSGLALGMAVLVLMPLLRYGFDRPESLFGRMITRVTSVERPIAGDAAAVVLDNLKNVVLMFNYTYDIVTVVNLPNTPAMDTVLGALLLVGAAATLALSVKARDPWPAVVLVAGVLMLLPSALSIAFPGENPSTVRTGGAIPMLMIVCAVGPGILWEMARRSERKFVRGVALACIGLVTFSVIGLNTDRVFKQYPDQYCSVGRNASDIARELEAFVAAGNPRANAWIVGYPHWVDYRAVGVWIGDITFPNQVVGPQEVAQVDLQGQPGWFALNVDDRAALKVLQYRYPRGIERVVVGSQCPRERFVVFTTGPAS